MKICRHTYRFTIPVTFVLLFLSCHEDATRPPAEPPPGMRNYVWTVDTLAYPGSFQTLMRYIWASSAHDIYVVGHNDQGGTGEMYHYNGASWTPIGLLAVDGGTLTHGFELDAVFGFGPNDVWAVGGYIYENPSPPPTFLDSSLIIHFDGIDWRDVPISRGRRLFALQGVALNTLTAMGRGGSSIYDYDGTSFRRDAVPFQFPPGGDFQFNSIAIVSPTELYAIGATHINSLPKDIFYFFHRVNRRWSVLDTAVAEVGIEDKWGYSKIWLSPWGKLYSVGLGVFTWSPESGWTKILDSDVYLTSIFGTGESNVFVVGQFGRVLHYNGTDWYQFTSLPPTDIQFTTEWIFGGWTDRVEVFLISQDSRGRNTLVFHGK